MSTAQIQANQSQIDSALNAINTIAQTTTFQGKNLLDGSLAINTTPGTNYATHVTNLNVNQANLGSTGSMTVTANVVAATTAALQTMIAPAATAVTASTTSAALGDTNTFTITGRAGYGGRG